MNFGNLTLVSADQDELVRELRGASDCEACLIVVRGKQQGKRFELSLPRMTLGRDDSCDIVIQDPRVSRQQATITKEAHAVKLIDGGSTNGTHINDRKIAGEDTVVLSKEDMIRMGDTILKYLPRGELEIHFIGTLESRAHTDALTKIYNKGYLLEAMDAEFKRAKVLGNDFSLLVFDLDFFKRVNDTLGHDAGDYVLVAVSKILKEAISACGGILGRFGGEEFVALLPGLALNNAMEVAESIRAQLESHPFRYQQQALRVTASIGAATMSSGAVNCNELFKQADHAVYAAKESGRNKVCSAIANAVPAPP